MKRRKTTEESATELQRQSEDSELWDQEPVQIEARPTHSSVVSIRLPTAEFHALLRAARSAGESVSQYVRGAIMLRLKNDQSTSTVNVSYTYSGMPTKLELQRWGTWNFGTAEAGELRQLERVADSGER